MSFLLEVLSKANQEEECDHPIMALFAPRDRQEEKKDNNEE